MYKKTLVFLFTPNKNLKSLQVLLFLALFKIEKNDYLFHNVCLSVRPHVTTRPPPNRFSWHLTLDYFSKICGRKFSRHRHHISCKVLGLVTCSCPINSLEVSWGVVLGFDSHMVDTPQLSVAVCLCPPPKMRYPRISRILNLVYNWANFKFR
jgi:hypothetical protein